MIFFIMQEVTGKKKNVTLFLFIFQGLFTLLTTVLRPLQTYVHQEEKKNQRSKTNLTPELVTILLI